MRMDSNYESFRAALLHDFGTMKIRDIKQLKTLMRIGKYHIVKDKETGYVGGAEPTTKQLDFALDVLRKRAVPVPVKKYGIREQYTRHYVYRANRNVEIGGRGYRRGQFIPYPKK